MNMMYSCAAERKERNMEMQEVQTDITEKHRKDISLH